MKIPRTDVIHLGDPPYFAPGSLESLGDDELARRKTETLDALQRIIDEQERRRWKLDQQPPVVYTGGNPDLRAIFG